MIEGGVTQNNYQNFNLATHVGDDLDLVERNRALLVKHYNLPSLPKYLEQVHSNNCLEAASAECVGDAVVTSDKDAVCCVLTADCLPIFASNKSGTKVGVAHAGWRSVVNGVIESFVNKFDAADLLIHFGPAISQKNFEVGKEVFDQFIDKDENLKPSFIKSGDKYKLDIYQAATIILNGLGVRNITGGDQCTFAQKGDYFSYRRDGSKSGRMANLIWIE